MQITQEVREYAKSLDVSTNQALRQGLQEKAEEFKAKGSEIYLEAE